MNRTRLAVVGAGRMGTHHAKAIARMDEADMALVVDVDPVRAELLAAAAGGRPSTRLEDVLACDAAIVATPPETHLDVALQLMRAEMPLLVEKPLAGDIEQARQLLDASARRRAPVTCGFVERFNPVVATAARIVADSGPVVHFVAIRHSPPDPYVTTSVVHDLLVHDIDLALRACAGAWTGEVSGGVWLRDGTAEIADCTLVTDAGAVATLSASRMSQRKVRHLEMSTPTHQLELDLLRRTITVYRHVRHEAPGEGGYRAETVMDIPFIHESGEPLILQLRHFLALARGEIDPAAERAQLLAAHEVAAKVEAGALGVGRALAVG